MVAGLFKKIFGTVNDRVLKPLQKNVDIINGLEGSIGALSDDELKAKTPEFKARLKNGETLDELLCEAFAVVREASKRVLNMRHYDVQLLGGMILHKGMIAEMKTGEGKTLVSTLPVYLNALAGKGVHVVTVNDYLAKRDSEWMGKVHEFLGLTVDCVVNQLDDEERQKAYACDVTYGTNNEFGFDYLRDNMKFDRSEMVQRDFNFAIVDEVDSILIDEARTPLIISGPTEDNSELYYKVDKLVAGVDKKDYDIDEKSKAVTFTEDGTENIEEILKKEGLLEENASMYDIASISLVHHVNQALRAHKLFSKDTDYVVKDNNVVIIDEFTGRMMEGRRYSDGLHQALEAKEGVPVQNENQTLASVTFQNYFRLYKKLAGMTGTAMTEADEFIDIYNLQVIEMPPNLPVARIDENDEIYRTADEKYNAIIEQIEECNKQGQPVLVGTISIERSEFLSKLLKKKKISHNVLNAKHHEKEAHIIAQAGRYKSVTIATNMAGRGTDIMLGGNPDMLLEEALESGKKDNDVLRKKIEKQVAEDKQKVIDAGGLYVLATERHESRRIDNQLRGRSGRQGDPGVTKFFLSLEDDLMRIFGSERISSMLEKIGMKEGESIVHPWISRSIEKAQQKVEGHNFEIRKNLLKFDDVMNDQRKVIYEQRLEIMDVDDVSDTIADMNEEILEEMVHTHIPPKSYFEQWDLEGMNKEMFRIYSIHLKTEEWAKEEGIADAEILEKLQKTVNDHLKTKEGKYGAEIMRLVEKKILLLTLDQLWKDHLLSLDHLRQGIGLRAYGQKDPLNEYKKEAFLLFESMLVKIREITIMRLSHTELNVDQDSQEDLQLGAGRAKQKMHTNKEKEERSAAGAVLGVAKSKVAPEDRDPTDPSTWGKVSRNEDCPCGSGKKYKKCHGKI